MSWFLLSIGLMIFCESAWTAVFGMLLPLPRAKTRWWDRITMHFHALLGSFTPGNAGSDVLRAWMNRRCFGIPYAKTWIASTYASILKLRVGLAVSVALLWPGKAWVAAAALLCASFFLARIAPVARRAPKVGWKLHAGIAAIFTVSFVCEAWAFAACLRGFSIDLPSGWLGAFSIVHLAARIPFLPQGIGLSEAAGYLVFSKAVGPERALPMMGMWGLVRITAPLILGAVFFRSGHWRSRALRAV